MKPLLISADKIKEFGVIEDNVDVKLINTTISLVQDMSLQQIIGTELYNEICDQVENDNLSVLNETLLVDYIHNYLMAMVIAEGSSTFLYRISNKAVVTSNSENQSPVNLDELNKVEGKWKHRAQFYSDRITKYLCENETLYPLYYNGNNKIDEINPTKTTKFGGLILRNDRREQNQRKIYPYCKENGGC